MVCVRPGSPNDEQRRLAAIVSADVAGCSRATQVLLMDAAKQWRHPADASESTAAS
jgi:hypothetical protein